MHAFHLLGLVAAMLAASPSWAQDQSSKLHESCEKLEASLVMKDGSVDFAKDFDTVFCWGFMSGVQSMVRYAPGGVRALPFCPPDSTPLSQYVKAYTAYGRRVPQDLKLPTPVSVLKALSQAFPCR